MAAPVIHETQLPPDISMGAHGGPAWKTRVAIAASGKERRIGRWAVPRMTWNIDFESRDLTQFAALQAFWYARNGPLNGFRFKDWTDFSVTDEPLFPTGASTVQLVKSYTSSPTTYRRNIYKPVASPAVTMKKNGGAFVGFTLDTTTGIVTLTAVLTKSPITGITLGGTTLIQFGSAHTFAVNDIVAFSGVGGTTQLNGTVGTITVINTPANSIRVAIDSTNYSAFTSSGTVTKYLTTTDTLSWTGTFDVPVRFLDDQPDWVAADAFIRSWSVQLIELVG